jgi:hypothetical protein
MRRGWPEAVCLSLPFRSVAEHPPSSVGRSGNDWGDVRLRARELVCAAANESIAVADSIADPTEYYGPDGIADPRIRAWQSTALPILGTVSL